MITSPSLLFFLAIFLIQRNTCLTRGLKQFDDLAYSRVMVICHFYNVIHGQPVHCVQANDIQALRMCKYRVFTTLGLRYLDLMLIISCLYSSKGVICHI